MEFIIATIIFILIIILFNKVSQLKKMIDYQELKIKFLQEELDKQPKTPAKQLESIRPEINQPKIEEPIREKIVAQAKPQPVLLEENKPIFDKLPPQEKTESTFDQFIDNTISFVKDNFLTIFGIVTLVLGIAYFVKYAIDQDWINETFRVIIGLVVGLTIIGIAHKIRKNFEIFSSILIGGGLTVLYFTLTIAFREYHILSQNATFALLTVVTIFSIVLAFLYNRQVLAIFSIIGGFSAPLMISTGESNFVFLFSYILLLNLSMLLMSLRKNWQIITHITFLFTAIYSFVWIDAEHTQTQYIFFVLIYIIFATTTLFNYLRKEEFSVWNCILFITNTLVSVILLSLVNAEIDYSATITAIFGVINALFAFYVYKTTQHKLLQNMLIALSISLITLAIALRFEANVVSICFAIESSLLLFLWKKSGENIFKILFIVMFPFLFIFLCINWIDYINAENHLPVILNHVFITSFIVSICTIINIYLMKDFETEEHFLGFKLSHSKFIFILTSILFIYTGILFELIYQIEPYFSATFITSYVFIYTLLFIASLLFVREKLKLGETIQLVLHIGAAICILLLPLFADIPNEANQLNFKISSYFIYLVYLIPSAYLFYLIFRRSDFKTSTPLQIISVLLLVYIISFESYNLFMIATVNSTEHNFGHQQDIFTMILLPIIWAISGFGLMYYGLKKELKAFPIVGIILFGLIILKLYLIDVWQMSNVFRIISFIVLGILILSTSFMYQKLKNLMKNLIDKPNENTEAEL